MFAQYWRSRKYLKKKGKKLLIRFNIWLQLKELGYNYAHTFIIILGIR